MSKLLPLLHRHGVIGDIDEKGVMRELVKKSPGSSEPQNHTRKVALQLG